jgi:hypothetical protein
MEHLSLAIGLMLTEEPYKQSKFKDTHLVKLELLSDATTIDNALNYIRNKQQSQQQITNND